MFLQVSVIHSVHRGGRAWFYSGGAGMCGFIRGGAWFYSGGHAWFPGFIRGACVVLFGGGMRGFFSFFGYNEIRSMSGRYASYWNAFLCIERIRRPATDDTLPCLAPEIILITSVVFIRQYTERSMYWSTLLIIIITIMYWYCNRSVTLIWTVPHVPPVNAQHTTDRRVITSTDCPSDGAAPARNDGGVAGWPDALCRRCDD